MLSARGLPAEGAPEPKVGLRFGFVLETISGCGIVFEAEPGFGTGVPGVVPGADSGFEVVRAICPVISIAVATCTGARSQRNVPSVRIVPPPQQVPVEEKPIGGLGGPPIRSGMECVWHGRMLMIAVLGFFGKQKYDNSP